ncbi:MAG TPA: DUF6597 domain-containing transcriptional factor, partial [Trebonia sp.]
MIDEHAVYQPGAALRPFVTRCNGYRQAGIEPTAHRGLPSPWLTMIITLDEPLVIARHPDPRQPASTHDFLLGGLHTTPALITHEGSQSGIQLALTPLGARAPLGLPAAETGWSARYLGEQFRAEMRLSPKAAARTLGMMASMSDETSKQPPPPNVWPTLRANDAHGLIKFLTEALGFEATAVYAEGDTVHHAELAWPPGGGVMLSSARPDDPYAVTKPGHFSAYVVTDDPDALHARAVAHGV